MERGEKGVLNEERFYFQGETNSKPSSEQTINGEPRRSFLRFHSLSETYKWGGESSTWHSGTKKLVESPWISKLCYLGTKGKKFCAGKQRQSWTKLFHHRTNYLPYLRRTDATTGRSLINFLNQTVNCMDPADSTAGLMKNSSGPDDEKEAEQRFGMDAGTSKLGLKSSTKTLDSLPGEKEDWGGEIHKEGRITPGWWGRNHDKLDPSPS